MSRYQRRNSKDPLEYLPPLVGVILISVFFVPGFRQLLGNLLLLVAVGVAVALVGLIVWLVWRKKTRVFDPDRQILNADSVPLENPGCGNVQPKTESAVKTFIPPVPRLEWSRELLSQLEWKRYEEVVAAFFVELGFQAKTTRFGADGGVDVQVFKDGQSKPAMIVQCKAWDAYKAGVKPVRELFGVMAADKVAEGAFFTTGEFTSEAKEWAVGKELDLVDGGEFLNRIRQLPATSSLRLLEIATKGDYTTPTCPSCDVKMVKRAAKKGSAEGREFWGCPNFSRGCRQTFKVT